MAGESYDQIRSLGAMGGGLGLLLVAIFLSLVAPSHSSSYGGSRALERQREFDYFVLALQWPGSFCKRTHHCCPSNGCCRSSAALDEFTIHGLWPDYNDGSWPACCTNSHFDKKKVSPLLEKLNKYWPSLSCSSSSLCHGGKGLFWAHEWEKHGTCSSPVINDEFSYFLTTLDLYFKYNMTEILNHAGISANNSEKYQLSDILAAVKNSTGASPLLVCSHDDIQELRLCFSKDLKPRDCTTASRLLYDSRNSRVSCPKYVSLPRHKPLVRREENVTPELAQVSAEMELVARD